ncbi:MAG: amidase [Armatimonadetes bacterium]|nr:amidase [Armatimonadota bacterium]
MNEKRPIDRRTMLKGLAGAGAGCLSLAAGAQGDGAVPVAEIESLDRAVGRAYTEPERALMARGLAENRDALQALRAFPLTEASEPSLLFQPILPDVKLPTGKPFLKLSKPARATRTAADGDLAFASVLQLSELIRTRKISSVELTRFFLDRLRKHGGELHCVVTLTEALAMRQAERADRETMGGKWRGPLHGIPWGAKDLLAVRKYPTTWGASPYADQILPYNATVAQRLDEAGAVLCAKLSLGELAMGDVWFGGLTRNPWQPDKGSSGSSAGPASALAAGLVAFAIGSETLGSIVSPSVRCGVTGLRPTFGRVPKTGAMALSWSMDKLGPMARCVEDCTAVLGAIYGPDGSDQTAIRAPFRWDAASPLKGLRVGIDEAAFADAAKGADAQVYGAVVDTLKRLGVKLVPVKLPVMGPAYEALAGLIIGCEGAAAFEKLNSDGKLAKLAQQTENSWPNLFRIGSLAPAADYITAMRVRRNLQVEFERAVAGVDCYVTPPFGSLVATNLTGHPTVITRCGLVNGIPRMVEFTGRLCREDAALRVALAYEQATEWHKQWPKRFGGTV